MSGSTRRRESDATLRPAAGLLNPTLTRRGLLGAGALAALASLAAPTPALAWSSWTNAASDALKKTGMGDCVHEDMVQIAYARMVRSHANDSANQSLLNPWGGKLQSDTRFADIAGDTVDAGVGKGFAGAEDLAARLFRENLAYLRIGSYWNDAAANTLMDFGYSCACANSIPKFSGSNHYEGAWDVGQHISETHQKNQGYYIKGLDALVQFTMNDRNNFIHGMLTSTADHSSHLKQSEIKRFALQWLSVAYEYARTGKVTTTSDVASQGQAEKIFEGFIDTYGQLDMDLQTMSGSLKVGASEASIKLPHRRLRLRALGMACHTLEDLWCPAHTCRSYHAGGSIPQNSILAFENYALQNGNCMPMNGYHIPFDRYALSDAKNATNWREALTRGATGFKGSETLANVLDDSMSCLDSAHTYFNTLGMNESIATITKLFEYLYQDTAWDSGVRSWIDSEIMPTYFDSNGQSYICDAGRRSLHTPTFIISPLKGLKNAYEAVGLLDNHKEILAAAIAYDKWQRGTHSFFSGDYNTKHSRYVTSGLEGDAIWDDKTGEGNLVSLIDNLLAGYSSLSAEKKQLLLDTMGSNNCHNVLIVLGHLRGLLQDFAIDLTGSLRPESDAALVQLGQLRAFFESGVKGKPKNASAQALEAQALLASAEGEEGLDEYESADMAIEFIYPHEDGSFDIFVRDMDSLEVSVMQVPTKTPGIELLDQRRANLTISYTLDMEFEDDSDYNYVVKSIEEVQTSFDTYFCQGTVAALSEDKKSLTFQSNDSKTVVLSVSPELTTLPELGEYICARYNDELVLLDFDELEKPGPLTKVTYPVEEVNGTNVVLITNADTPEDGYPDYLQIEYDMADVFGIPRVGEKVTVYYYDEAFDDTADADERALVAAAYGTGDATALYTTEDPDDELSDSPDPGYLELGDEYGTLVYGNDVRHIAVIISSPEAPEPHEGEDTGWHQDGTGAWYYVENGVRATGWTQVEGSWYHFGTDGTMDAGWYQDADGSWYYLSSAHDGSYGAMMTGWQKLGNKWFLLNPAHDGGFGKMLTGWQQSGGYWYYLSEAHDGSYGAMVTGWLQLDGSWYYLRENAGGPLGSCVMNGVTPDGYRVDASGRWIK